MAKKKTAKKKVAKKKTAKKQSKKQIELANKCKSLERKFGAFFLTIFRQKMPILYLFGQRSNQFAYKEWTAINPSRIDLDLSSSSIESISSIPNCHNSTHAHDRERG